MAPGPAPCGDVRLKDPAASITLIRQGPHGVKQEPPKQEMKKAAPKPVEIPSDWSADMMRECADSCNTTEELTELWTANQNILDAFKNQDRTNYEALIQHFKALKTKLKG